MQAVLQRSTREFGSIPVCMLMTVTLELAAIEKLMLKQAFLLTVMTGEEIHLAVKPMGALKM